MRCIFVGLFVYFIFYLFIIIIYSLYKTFLHEIWDALTSWPPCWGEIVTGASIEITRYSTCSSVREFVSGRGRERVAGAEKERETERRTQRERETDLIHHRPPTHVGIPVFRCSLTLSVASFLRARQFKADNGVHRIWLAAPQCTRAGSGQVKETAELFRCGQASPSTGCPSRDDNIAWQRHHTGRY